jgi:hypothetical protein
MVFRESKPAHEKAHQHMSCNLDCKPLVGTCTETRLMKLLSCVIFTGMVFPTPGRYGILVSRVLFNNPVSWYVTRSIVHKSERTPSCCQAIVSLEARPVKGGYGMLRYSMWEKDLAFSSSRRVPKVRVQYYAILMAY